jgi:hypothetical protein
MSMRRRTAGLLAFGTVLALAGTVDVLLTRAAHQGSPIPAAVPPGAHQYVCVEVGDDSGACDRVHADSGRRAPLRPDQLTKLGPDADVVQAAALFPGTCAGVHVDVIIASRAPGAPTPSPLHMAYCDGTLEHRNGTEKPGPLEVDAVRRALAYVGYPDAVVRLARPDDPAPAGGIVYAVPVRDACIVGYLATLKGPYSGGAAGRYPDGTCLKN